MLRHIVMWKFRPGTETERDLFLTGLQGLYGAIPELKSCQVLRGMEGSDYDAVLISEFADQAEPVRPGPGPAEQGIHRDLGLIGVPAVEVHGDDSALHGRLPPLSRRRAGNALLPL